MKHDVLGLKKKSNEVSGMLGTEKQMGSKFEVRRSRTKEKKNRAAGALGTWFQ